MPSARGENALDRLNPEVYATNKRKVVGDLLSDCNQFHDKFSLYLMFPFS